MSAQIILGTHQNKQGAEFKMEIQNQPKDKLKAICPQCKEKTKPYKDGYTLHYLGSRETFGEVNHVYRCAVGHVSELFEILKVNPKDMNLERKVKSEE